MREGGMREELRKSKEMLLSGILVIFLALLQAAPLTSTASSLALSPCSHPDMPLTFNSVLQRAAQGSIVDETV